AQRKAGKQAEVDVLEEVAQTEQVDATGETEEEAALSDEELCARYELPDPGSCTDSEQLDGFFDGQIPDRLRQLAMRRLWRLNPLFRFADEMVEYGEDFTDAATVIPNMQTAYKVGKGYMDKLLAEQEQADAETALSVEQVAEQDELKGTGDTDTSESTSESIEDSSEETTALAESGQQAEPDQAEDPEKDKDNEEQTGAKDSPVLAAEKRSDAERQPSETAIRPRRMVFTNVKPAQP
ncbi:MAG: DUF3306 domain-containing protein, partial [Pseudomonadota bacterium]|nr:DUF3306 domain-containing protein [Pseudomonadota bacterium]